MAREATQKATTVWNEVALLRENVAAISNSTEENMYRQNSLQAAAEDEGQELNDLGSGADSSNNDRKILDEKVNILCEDTYTFMMINKPFVTKSWWLGLATFVVQMALLILLFIGQYSTSAGTTIFDVPFKVSESVRAGQIFALFIAIMISHDILMPVKDLNLLWYTKGEWCKVLAIADTHKNGGENYQLLRQNHRIPGHRGRAPINRRRIWIIQIIIPSILKFLQGVMVLIITFVIVIQCDDIIDLFKDLAAMQVISELDDAVFTLADNGYFGPSLKDLFE